MEEKGLIRLNRTGNAIRNIIFGAVNKFVMLICPFVVRTILIRTLGIEYAGLNNLFVSILDVLNLSELGLSSAIVYCMYKPIAYNDERSICALLKLFRKLYFAIGMFILFVGIAILPLIKYFIKGSCPNDINLYVLYLIYLLNSCMSYFFMGYRSVILSAHQRMDIIQNTLTIIKAIMYIAQVIVLVWWQNYYIYAIMLPIFTIIINLVTALESKRIFPQYTCCGEVSSETKKDLKQKTSGLMVTKLCFISRNSFDSIFISAFGGLAISAIYANYYFIMHAVTSVLGIIVQAVLAGVGNSIQTESIEQNYSDLKRFNFMYLWISGTCTACLLCLYQPFMYMWMGKDNLLPISSIVLFCMYFFILTMGDIQSIYYNAAGLWWHYRKSTIIEAILNLILNYILVKIWGVNGIIAGTLISLFLVAVLYQERLVFKYYFKNNMAKEFYLQQCRYATTTLIVCFATYKLCQFITSHIDGKGYGISILLVRMVICLAVSNMVYLVAYRKTDEFRSSVSWILNIIKKYRKQRIL